MEHNIVIGRELTKKFEEFNRCHNHLSRQPNISLQKRDPSIDQMMKWIGRHTVPTKDDLATQTRFVISLSQQIDQLVIEEDVLVSREDLNFPIFRIIIPRSLVEEVINDEHERGVTSHKGWRRL